MLPGVFFAAFIVLFIGGMAVMRTGLMNISGDSLKRWLLAFTSTPWKGMVFGIVVTVLLQSSSAVMIITVGLISAKLFTFEQSIGIILGTNIGTTATVEFLAYETEEMIFPLLIAGSLFLIFPNKRVKSTGMFLYGLGAVLFAMEGFERLATPLGKSAFLASMFSQMNEEPWIAAGVGTLVTAVIQSSTAMTGIAMGFVEENILSLQGAIAVMLGSNIGTCVDALVAAIGGGKEAKLSAYAHIWINVFGVLMFFPFLSSFTEFTRGLSPFPDQQLAHASVLFNVAVSLLILPFAKPFAKLLEKIHGPL